jgi:hypothetical protein
MDNHNELMKKFIERAEEAAREYKAAVKFGGHPDGRYQAAVMVAENDEGIVEAAAKAVGKRSFIDTVLAGNLKTTWAYDPPIDWTPGLAGYVYDYLNGRLIEFGAEPVSSPYSK